VEEAAVATSSTSRVLRGDDQTAVTPIWWRETGTPPQGVARDPKAAMAGDRRATDSSSERERLEREGFQRGFAEGTATGKQQAMGEMQPVIDRMGRTLGELSTLRSRIHKDAERDLLKLSITIARRILHRELTIDPESVEGLIKVALEKLQSRDLNRVRVHPGQAAAIRASLDRFSNSQKIELVADASLQIGDVLFETAHGTLDASLESQLKEIDRGFADRLQR
jgi:flagellar assembly protein FliH